MRRGFPPIPPYRKPIGLVLLSMGTGMLIVLIIPGWGYLLAATMVILGFWSVFMCN